MILGPFLVPIWPRKAPHFGGSHRFLWDRDSTCFVTHCVTSQGIFYRRQLTSAPSSSYGRGTRTDSTYMYGTVANIAMAPRLLILAVTKDADSWVFPAATERIGVEKGRVWKIIPGSLFSSDYRPRLSLSQRAVFVGQAVILTRLYLLKVYQESVYSINGFCIVVYASCIEFLLIFSSEVIDDWFNNSCLSSSSQSVPMKL